MSETKFTNGPWFTGVHANGSWEVNDDDADSVQWNPVTDSEGNAIAFVVMSGDNFSDWDEQLEARARLIAAAPELFDFVQDCANGRPEFECRRRAIALLAKVSP